MKRKVFRGALSFDKAELFSMAIHDAGIQMGRPAVSDEEKRALIDTLQGAESFGMFDSGADTNKYYPSINSAQDIIPKPEDFVNVPFRLLTATIVGAGTWKATDFSNATKLKASMPMLAGKPVYRNHDLEVDNFVGYVQSVSWENASKQNNIVVPAGINGILAIDAKTEPKLARGVLMGAIYSNSVTVEFDWEMSHPFEDEWEFLNKVGTIAKDGTMIRRIVKNIYNYHETSLVFLGADPFAKLIDDNGELKNIDTGSIEYDKADSSEQDKLKKQNRIDVGRDGAGLCLDKAVIWRSRENFAKEKQLTTTVTENNIDMKELFAFLAIKFKIDVATITEANYMSYVNKLDVPTEGVGVFQKKAGLLDSMVSMAVANISDDNLGKLELSGEGEEIALPEKVTENYVMVKKDELTKVKSDLATVTAEKDSLAKDAALGKEYIGLKRSEGVRLYKLAMGEKFSQAVIDLIEAAEGDALEGLISQYTKGVAVKFKATCKTCNSSENISFKSTVSSEKDEESLTKKPVQVTTVSDIYAKYDQSPMDARKN